MSDKIFVQPLSKAAHIADRLMLPLMYAVSGTWRETPQQTHRWNNTKLKPDQVKHLAAAKMVSSYGKEAREMRSWFDLPLFHLPICGGWKDYTVLQPDCDIDRWHVGWIAKDVIGVSRIQIQGPVRLLTGSGPVSFFGVNLDGDQIKLEEIATGRVGSHGPYAKVPLL